MSYNQQITIYIESSNSYSINFSYNQNTTFQDLFEYIMYNNPEKNLCLCYKMQYYHNSNGKYYDLTLNESVYNYIDNNSYKQYNFVKKNRFAEDEHERHNNFFKLSKINLYNVLNKYMKNLEKEINNFSEIKKLNKIELIDYDEEKKEEHQKLIEFLNSIFYDKGYNKLIEKFDLEIQRYEEEKNNLNKEINRFKDEVNKLENFNNILIDEINGNIDSNRINELSKLGIKKNLKPRQNLIRIDPKTNQMIGNEQSIKTNFINFYDIIIAINSMRSINRGWEIKKSKRVVDNYKQLIIDKVLVIGVIGNSNKGKSYLLSKISKIKDLPSGTSIRTEGLSIKYPELETFKDRKIVLLDSAGLETPVLNEEEKKVEENEIEEINKDDKDIKTKEDNKTKENNEENKDKEKEEINKKTKKDNKNNDNNKEENKNNDENDEFGNNNEKNEENEKEKIGNNDMNKEEIKKDQKGIEEISKNKVENNKSKENKNEISEEEKRNTIFKENSRDKLITEMFLQNYIMSYSDILIVVVGILTYSEQKLLCKIKNEILKSDTRKDKEKSLFIIHNLMTYTTIEQVEDYIANCLLKSSTFSLVEGHKVSTNTKTKCGIYYNEKYVDTKIYHLFFANEGSEAGNFYNNYTLDFIEHSYQHVTLINSFNAIETVKNHFCKIYKEIIDKTENISTPEFDNTNENYIKLINPKIVTLKSCSINELGISNLVSNGFEPAYNVYKKDNKIIVRIESGGNTKIEANLEREGENTYFIISGEKTKDKEPENLQDNIKNLRKFGAFHLQIPINGDYIIKNENPKITEKKGILSVEYNLDDKICGGKFEPEDEI